VHEFVTGNVSEANAETHSPPMNSLQLSTSISFSVLALLACRCPTFLESCEYVTRIDAFPTVYPRKYKYAARMPRMTAAEAATSRQFQLRRDSRRSSSLTVA